MRDRRRIRLGVVMIDSPKWTGGGIYVRNLVYALASVPPDERPEVRLVGVADPASPLVRDLRNLGCVCESGVEAGGVATSRINALGARLRRRLLGRSRGARPPGEGDQVDVLYPAGFGVDVSGAVRLYWIADFQHIHLPQLFSRRELWARQRGMAEVARQDAVLVLSSHSALDDFWTAFPSAVVRPRVWSFCSSFGPAEDGGAHPGQAYGLRDKFLYLPNQFWVHKDHLTAFKALALLRAKGIEPVLVCTGLEDDYRDPGHFQRLMDYIRREGLQEHVRCLGLVPRRDQIQIFRHAAAVLQPSLFEGWSTVVEDAKALGRPLILSDIPPHREQAVEGARFFRARSPENLAGVIAELWPSLRPGPDLMAERRALGRTTERRVELGRAFMAIVDEALAVGHPT